MNVRPIVRPATSADLDALCDLLAVLFAHEVEFTPDRARNRRGLEQLLAAPELGRLLVLESAGRVVGMVNLLFTVSTALGERVAWLEDLVVAPDARGGGAGSALLREALAVARSAGCARITLLTDGANRDAQRLYERHGFAASSMLPMRLPLPVRDEPAEG